MAITSEHQRAIDLMARAQATTNETQANNLISQAMQAAEMSGRNNATVFAAVVAHAQQIQERNVALRPQPEPARESSPSPPSGGGTPAPPPPPPKPVNPWITTSNFVAPTGIKQADPDIVLFNERPISPEYMVELEYETIAGMELINISRSDLINGQQVVYSPIKNLSLIRRRYNPNNIINLSELSASFFSRFAIDLVQRGMNDPYFDDEGNLIIEIDNVRDDEVIEVEIDTNATIEEVIFV